MRLYCGMRLQSSQKGLGPHNIHINTLWCNKQWSRHHRMDCWNLRWLSSLKPSSQNANMVRLTPASHHARAMCRVWVALGTHDYLHQQLERILINIYTNDTHWLQVSQTAHPYVFMIGLHLSPLQHNMSQPMRTFHDNSSHQNRVEKFIFGLNQWISWQYFLTHSDH